MRAKGARDRGRGYRRGVAGDGTQRAIRIVPWAALAVGIALRAAGLDTAYWFDEVWTTDRALAFHGFADIYARTHDNNHLTTSWWIHLLGADAGEPAWRSLAFASGLVALALATFDRACTPVQRAVRGAWFAVAPLAVVLSSEARGYAPALAAALGAYALLRARLAGRSGTAAVVGFNALLVFGLLSHLVFAYFAIAAFAFAACEVRARAGRARELAALFAAPFAFAAFHGVAFVRHMATGGAPDFAFLDFAVHLVALGFGAPESAAFALPLAAAAFAAFVAHLVAARRSGDGRWVFDFVVVLAAPAIVLSLFDAGVIAARYFVLQVAFAGLVLADRLGDALARGGAARVAAAAVLLLVAAGSAGYHVRFLEHGRGDYAGALRAIAAAEPAPAPLRIGGDHDFRTRKLVEYHGARLDPPRDVRFVAQDEWPAAPPEWFVDHAVYERRPPQRGVEVLGRRFVFVERFDAVPPSGFRWDLYRLAHD